MAGDVLIYSHREEPRKIKEETKMTHINNLPRTVRAWIVAREVDGELWFWGSWDSREAAQAAAWDIGGVVVSRDWVEA